MQELQLNTIYNRRLFWQKIGFTLGVITIYILGMNIPIPGVHVEQAPTQVMGRTLFDFAISLSGGDKAAHSMMGLGITPYMSGMIIWRFVSLAPIIRDSKITTRRLQQGQMLLTLLIAVLQALATSVGWTYTGIPHQQGIAIAMASLIGGAFILIWLGNLNSQYGVGQTTVFILIGMLARWTHQIINYLVLYRHLVTPEFKLIIAAFMLYAFIIMIVNITLGRAQLRIKMYRSAMSTDKELDTYYPLPLNPAGGMPWMYTMSLMVLPVYLIQLLLLIWPNQPTLMNLMHLFRLDNLSGIIVYLTVLFLLSIGFSFVNIDPKEIAKNMQKNGNYLVNVRPGVPTQKVIQRNLFRLALFGATYSVTLGGLPMFLRLVNPEIASLTMIPGMMMLFVGLFMSIVDELDAIRAMNRYQSLVTYYRRG